MAGVVDAILATLSPLQDSAVPIPKDAVPLRPIEGEFLPLSEGSLGIVPLWGGPSMKMPWDQSVTHRYTGGPHNWTMRWDCYLAPVEDANGLDFGMSYVEVLAVAGGTVQWDYGGPVVGNYTIVDHDDGWSTRYLHLSEIDPSLSWGETISQGRVLGISGTAGTGPHLHLELRYNDGPTTWHGTAIDGYIPRMYVNAADESRGWNYQGTLTRGFESMTSITYCDAQTITWMGSGRTIVAGDSQPVPSTNQRHTGDPPLTPAPTSTPAATPTPVPAPDVSIDKEVIGSDFGGGRFITFTLAIANRGDKIASHVIVTDIIPSQVLAPAFTSTLALTPTGPLSYVWDVGVLGTEKWGIITITGWINPGLGAEGVIYNTATIWDPEDITPANNTDAVVVGGLKVYLPLSLRETSTLEPPPTPAPPDCGDGVENGGFEYDGVWEIPGEAPGVYPADYTTAEVNSGKRSMRIGLIHPDDDQYAWSSARQLVTIPSNASSAAFRFWLYPLTEEEPMSPSEAPLSYAIVQASLSSDDDDLQMVRILDESDEFLDSLVRQRSDDQDWVFHEHDMLRYAGQTVKLYFGVMNNGQGGITAMYVDDVSLELCAPASPPQ